MKAKKVYEFKRTRKQGLSNQTELGVTIYKRKEIEDWFKKWKPNWIEGQYYEIKDDLSIIVNGNLDLKNTQITNLPDNLYIDGYLDLRRTNITELPDNLNVDDFLDLEESNIIELPDNLSIGGFLDIRRTNITKLPNNLNVNGNLVLVRTKITELPEDLYVENNIFISKDMEDYFKDSKFKNQIEII